MLLAEIADRISATLRGKADSEVTSVASFDQAGRFDLVFVEDAKYADAAIASKAGAVVTGVFPDDVLARIASSKPLLVAENPRLAFARAAEWLRRSDDSPSAIHPSAVIDASSRLATGVSVGAGAYVGPGVEVGKHSSIGPGCVLLSKIVIGDDCTLVARVTVYPKTTIGNRAMIHAGAVLGSDGFGFVRDSQSGGYEKFPQIGSLVIGDDVEIGANSTIDRGALDATVIGNGVKLDNLVHIAHNVEVGSNVVIAAQTGVSGSSIIERNCIVAGQVGIADHVRIEEGAILGAQCGVPTKKVIRGPGVVFWGTPARPIAEYLRELAALARLARRKKSGD
jgi:UDP-3-O-[3-hydroxymyristoyl] glucosamine N-acyltransferase